MAQGKVTVNNLNLSQGATSDIERKLLFIGTCATGLGTVISLDSQSDLSVVLGADDSELKTQVLAAQQNGGENWQAYAAPQAATTDWRITADEAFNHISVEGVVLCTPAANKTAVVAVGTALESFRTSKARRLFALVATAGITESQTWSAYETAQAAITKSVAAYRVAVVPLLHSNDVGALAGRLCNRAVSIADSPMRVATGPVLGLGESPSDKDGVQLSDATLAALDVNRLSVVQHYVDYPGTYFGDGNLLDAPGGDYQVIENLRVVDKAARAVRILSIARVANRSFNSTPMSIAANKTYFAGPLRAMSQSTVFNGEHFPGEIKPPADDAITIQWLSKTEVAIYLKLSPYNSPKAITANIVLDLTSE